MRGARSSASDFSPAKQILLEKRLQGALAGAPKQPTIAPSGRNGSAPLSFAQQRLWFLDQLIPGSAVYNISEVLRLHGKPDVSALEWSFGEVIRRHESLRTTFSARDGQPVQAVSKPAGLKLDVVDLQHLPAGEREIEMRRLVLEESKRPFDLACDLMIRGMLIRIGPADHVLAITMHHIASDAWSLGVLYRELGQLYTRRVSGEKAMLPDLPIQYADYAVWQRQWLEGKVLAEQLAYWKQQLAGVYDFLELPTDKQRPAVQSFRGGSVWETLSPEITMAVKQLSRQEGATLFMTLLAAFNVLLHRYARQTDIICGSPIAGRTQIETEELIGFFVNTLVLRNDLSGNPTFRELIQRIRMVTLDAYANQDLPFEKLVMELKPERSSSHTPLFQVMFVLHNSPASPLSLPGLSITPMPIDNETSKFDLILSVVDNGEGLLAGFEYNDDIFEVPTIARMLSHFSVLLTGLIKNPEARIGELAMVTEQETHQLLHEWNGTRINYPREQTIQQLFEAEAKRVPEAVALTFQERNLSYRALNAQANQLARALRKQGVGQGSLVGICMERSAEVIVGLLGILKAGGAYVSLDPCHPSARLAMMIDDVQPAVILTQSRFRAVLPAGAEGNSGSKIICFEELQLSRESSEDVEWACSPEDLAYISFTSGSTGRPKGVCVPHHGVVRLVRNTNYVEVRPGDVFLQFAPIAFDASTFEIWGCLLNGARLVVFPPEFRALSELAATIEREKVSILWVTTGLFQQLVEEHIDQLRRVRQVLTGGEVLSFPHAKRAVEGLPGCLLINCYGPTENTTFTSFHCLTADSLKLRSVPIGKPIANTEVYILDEYQRLVAPGVPGELYVGGDGLARGYLRRPELTVEKFVAHPFATETAARLYKTGDLVRWLPNGEIEFLGRLDEQVKIRGFRVEPAEIEAVLVTNPKLRDCVIAVQNTPQAGKRLICYFVTEGNNVVTGDELRDFLRQRLPDYMVPTFFVPLSELPLNKNGKVDRKALPPVENSPVPTEQAAVKPRDEIEARLAKLWERVLGVEQVGIGSNFFELGGHSLLAVRLVAQIEREFGRKISVASLFQAPTVETLSRTIRGHEAPEVCTSVVPIQSRGNRPPLFFVHGVGGGMFWGYTNLSKYLGPDQPVYALKSRAMDGGAEFSTIKAMATQYILDIRKVQPAGPYHLGGYCFGGVVAFEMAQQLEALGERVAFLGLINCGPPNSSYSKVRWTPDSTVKFVKNLVMWVRHSLEWTRAQRRDFVQWKVRSIKKRLRRIWEKRNGNHEQVDVDTIVDLSVHPEEQRGLWEAHIQTLIQYHPLPYPGRITLFRSPWHQLFCSFDEEYGWGELAQDGVDVRIVSGAAHELILEEPHVRLVAQQMKECLDDARRRVRSKATGEQPRKAPLPEELSAQSPAVGEAFLTPLQQKLWDLSCTVSGDQGLNVSECVELRGLLDVNALQKSLSHTVRSHDLLRARFASRGDQVKATVMEQSDFALKSIDLGRGVKTVGDDQSLQVARSEAFRQFDFGQDCLLRATLIQCRPDLSLLVLSSPRLIADETSMQVILKQVAANYERFCEGQAPCVTEPILSFAEWAHFPRSSVADDARRATETSRGSLHWSRLPFGSTTNDPGFIGRIETLSLPLTFFNSLKRLSHRQGVTLLMMFLAACGVLVCRYSRQENFAVATMVSVRNRTEIKRFASLFGDVLVCNTTVKGDTTFLELLATIKKSLTEPGSEMALLDHLPLPRSISQGALIPLLVGVEDAEPPRFSNLSVRPINLGIASSPAEAALVLVERGSELLVKCIYNAAIYNQPLIARLLDHLRVVFEQLVANPEAPVSELPIPAAIELNYQAVDWNQTSRPYPCERPYCSIFEDQARQTPAAIAVRAGTDSLTYSALESRANQLAHFLKKRRIGPETLVAIHAERSVDFAIAVLATLKTGAAYLPMDPDYPKDRLAWMLSDSHAEMILTTRILAGKLPPGGPVVIAMDDPKLALELDREDSDRAPQFVHSPDHLAYVIYTSGSTGKPKGVEISYRSLINHNLAIQEAFNLGPADRVLQFTPLSFDISVEEILPTWLAGSTLVFRNQDALGSISKFFEFVERENITVLNLPTAYFHAVTEFLETRSLPRSVRLVVIGGEKVSPDHWVTWHQLTGNSVQLINAYGLTETTITSTIFRSDGDLTRSNIPIGRPIGNTTAYILDELLQPVPPGTAAELLIGGLGVARGYRNSPRLSEGRFVADPFVPGAGNFLCRTGDLARFLPDGNIEFLGRLDDQIKLRGFRIQLGEIEAALSKHPGISQAVVRATAYGDKDQRLVAWFVVTGGSSVRAGELISFLQQTLPEYMIPSAFVKMDSLPLTPSGKVDHKALPLPGTDRPALSQSYVAPRTELEEKIAKVWRDVLHVDEIGVDDNFFDLGGHSLHAMRVMGRLGDVLNLAIPISNLFEAPTVAALARAIEKKGPEMRSAISGPIAGTADETDAPLSFAQQRLWFLHQLQPELPLYNVPQAARLSGKLDIPSLERTFSEIVQRHEVLRTTYQVQSGQPVQAVSDGPAIPISVVDLSTLRAEEKDRRLREAPLAEARKPFALDRDPMLRVVLLKLAEEEHLLLMTLHHISADGWSIEVLWKEIAALYGAFLKGRPAPLPPLPIQYADFAVWQRTWLQGDLLESQLAYWRKQLDGAPALLELPIDRPRPAVQTFSGARQPLALSAALADSLKALSQAEGCTLFMTLLAGFQTLLSRYSNSDDVVVGTVIANRNRHELEHLIGFFANTLVLRTDFSGNPTFREILRRTRGTTLDAYAHQDLPFERLVEELHPTRDPSYHPVFQVMLVLQNVPVPAQPLPGMTLSPSDTDTGISKFDLLLNLVETEDGLSGFVEYSTDLFEQGTIERMVSHFETILGDAVARPDCQVSRLQLMPEAERRTLLIEWNSGQIQVPDRNCIHHLFEEQAARMADRVALVCGEQRLTYGELNRRSNQIAHHLRSLGVGPEARVGICTGRSPDMVVAMLGILKAGAGYVPIDPAYPQERLQCILEDASAAVVLTESRLVPLLESGKAQLVCLDAHKRQIELNSSANPQLELKRENLAYVIFTSGSTGRPKGVAIEHRSVLSLIAWAKSTFSDEELDGVLAGTSICFDLSVYEILVPLALGGKIILAENVIELPKLPARAEVRLVNTVPSAILELIRSRGIPASVQTVNLAGEPLAQSVVESLYALPHVRRVFDLYGPTEATVYSTFALRTRGGRSHIGRPLPNEQLYVVDRNFEPVPIGVPGELLIGGAGLARGYLDRPDLTADRFIQNRFDETGQSRVYRTGDLVRYLPDGRVEYLGRIDQQVKIRGFRIELGEVEAQLRKHEAIAECIVIADQDPHDNKRLVAYVAPEAAARPAELRDYLKRSLPEYMVPSLFVGLEKLPLTPNGKVNRKALPKPEARLDSHIAGSDEPSSDAEILLAQIWCDVLGVPRVGVHQNFFDLGGHSLMITRILSRLKESLQVDLPMKALFEAPTVTAFAGLVESAMIEQISSLSDEEVYRMEQGMGVLIPG